MNLLRVLTGLLYKSSADDSAAVVHEYSIAAEFFCFGGFIENRSLNLGALKSRRPKTSES